MACGSSCCEKDKEEKTEQVKSCCSKNEEKETQSSCNSKNLEEQNLKSKCCSKKGKKCDGSCKNEGCNCTALVNYYLNSNNFPSFSITSFHKKERNLWSYLSKIPKSITMPIWQPPKINS